MLIPLATLLIAPSAQLWERRQPSALPNFSLESVRDGRRVTDEEFADQRTLFFLFDGVDDELIAPLRAELSGKFAMLQAVGLEIVTVVRADADAAQAFVERTDWPGLVLADPRGFLAKYGRPNTAAKRHFWERSQGGKIEPHAYLQKSLEWGTQLSNFLPSSDSYGNRNSPGWFRRPFEGKLPQGRLILFQGGGAWKLKVTALSAELLDELGPGYILDQVGGRISAPIRFEPNQLTSVQLGRGYPARLVFPDAPDALQSSVELLQRPDGARLLAEGHAVQIGIGWSYWIFENGNLPIVLVQAKNLTATTGYWDHKSYSCIGSTFGYWIRHDDEGLNLEGTADSGGFGCGVYSDGELSDEIRSALRFPPGASRYFELTMGSEEAIGRDRPYGKKLRGFGIAKGLTLPIKDVPFEWSDFGIDPNITIICTWREGLGSSLKIEGTGLGSEDEEPPPEPGSQAELEDQLRDILQPLPSDSSGSGG